LLPSKTRSFSQLPTGLLTDREKKTPNTPSVSGKTDPPDDRMNINLQAIRKNCTIIGMLNGPRDRFEELLTFCDKHQLKPVIDKVFGFEEAREALAYLWAGSHFGKVVVEVNK